MVHAAEDTLFRPFLNNELQSVAHFIHTSLSKEETLGSKFDRIIDSIEILLKLVIIGD